MTLTQNWGIKETRSDVKKEDRIELQIQHGSNSERDSEYSKTENHDEENKKNKGSDEYEFN